jgi:hypothetical protein
MEAYLSTQKQTSSYSWTHDDNLQFTVQIISVYVNYDMNNFSFDRSTFKQVSKLKFYYSFVHLLFKFLLGKKH